MSSADNHSPPSVNYWAVVPAAGVGARMAADRPKQYLPLAGRTVIEHSLDALLNHPDISAAVVAISASDGYWADLNYLHGNRHGKQQVKNVQMAIGGAERCDSVLNALRLLADTANENDWVLVHDAARPCLRQGDISRLIEGCKNHPVGGILAVPVKDTIKQSCKPSDTQASQDAVIRTTVDRESLWHAQTPQMFRLGMLRDALEQALSDGVLITDEASALEHAGQQPLLIAGHADNLKITCPEDLPLAEFYLSQR